MTRSANTNYQSTGTEFQKATEATDVFLKEDLQKLAAAVDLHDHSANRGLAVQRLGTGVVSETNLANDAVTFDKLADHASTDASRAVGTNHIRDSAVTQAKIADGAVTSTKLGTGASLGLAFPRCYAGYTASALSVSNTTLTAVPFGAADIYDTANMHSPTVNNTRITMASSAWYLLFGFVKWAGNTTGRREVYIRFVRSAVTTYLQVALSANTNSSATVLPMQAMMAPFELQANDYVELVVWQDSGGSLTVADAGFGATAVGV